jgi:hypothetical protein
MAGASDPMVRLVGTSNARSLAVTIIAFHLESAPNGSGRRLVGAVELRIKNREQIVWTQVVEAVEPVNGEMPGNLAVATGNLLHRIATSCFALASEMS